VIQAVYTSHIVLVVIALDLTACECREVVDTIRRTAGVVSVTGLCDALPYDLERLVTVENSIMESAC
jgi:hypothetical protein